MSAESPAVAVINSRRKAAETMALALANRGMHAVSATIEDGVAAFLFRHHPDAIVFDLEPREDVIAAFEFARESGLLRGKPLVVTTADARTLSTILRPSDQAAVFETPFDVEEIVSAIRRLLGPAP